MQGLLETDRPGVNLGLVTYLVHVEPFTQSI